MPRKKCNINALGDGLQAYKHAQLVFPKETKKSGSKVIDYPVHHFIKDAVQFLWPDAMDQHDNSYRVRQIVAYYKKKHVNINGQSLYNWRTMLSLRGMSTVAKLFFEGVAAAIKPRNTQAEKAKLVHDLTVKVDDFAEKLQIMDDLAELCSTAAGSSRGGQLLTHALFWKEAMDFFYPGSSEGSLRVKIMRLEKFYAKYSPFSFFDPMPLWWIECTLNPEAKDDLSVLLRVAVEALYADSRWSNARKTKWVQEKYDFVADKVEAMNKTPELRKATFDPARNYQEILGTPPTSPPTKELRKVRDFSDVVVSTPSKPVPGRKIKPLPKGHRPSSPLTESSLSSPTNYMINSNFNYSFEPEPGKFDQLAAPPSPATYTLSISPAKEVSNTEYTPATPLGLLSLPNAQHSPTQLSPATQLAVEQWLVSLHVPALRKPTPERKSRRSKKHHDSVIAGPKDQKILALACDTPATPLGLLSLPNTAQCSPTQLSPATQLAIGQWLVSLHVPALQEPTPQKKSRRSKQHHGTAILVLEDQAILAPPCDTPATPLGLLSLPNAAAYPPRKLPPSITPGEETRKPKKYEGSIKSTLEAEQVVVFADDADIKEPKEVELDELFPKPISAITNVEDLAINSKDEVLLDDAAWLGSTSVQAELVSGCDDKADKDNDQSQDSPHRRLLPLDDTSAFDVVSPDIQETAKPVTKFIIGKPVIEVEPEIGSLSFDIREDIVTDKTLISDYLSGSCSNCAIDKKHKAEKDYHANVSIRGSEPPSLAIESEMGNTQNSKFLPKLPAFENLNEWFPSWCEEKSNPTPQLPHPDFGSSLVSEFEAALCFMQEPPSLVSAPGMSIDSREPTENHFLRMSPVVTVFEQISDEQVQTALSSQDVKPNSYQPSFTSTCDITQIDSPHIQLSGSTSSDAKSLSSTMPTPSRASMFSPSTTTAGMESAPIRKHTNEIAHGFSIRNSPHTTHDNDYILRSDPFFSDFDTFHSDTEFVSNKHPPALSSAPPLIIPPMLASGLEAGDTGDTWSSELSDTISSIACRPGSGKADANS